jgi:hypothetical protein
MLPEMDQRQWLGTCQPCELIVEIIVKLRQPALRTCRFRLTSPDLSMTISPNAQALNTRSGQEAENQLRDLGPLRG